MKRKETNSDEKEGKQEKFYFFNFIFASTELLQVILCTYLNYTILYNAA